MRGWRVGPWLSVGLLAGLLGAAQAVGAVQAAQAAEGSLERNAARTAPTGPAATADVAPSGAPALKLLKNGVVVDTRIDPATGQARVLSSQDQLAFLRREYLRQQQRLNDLEQANRQGLALTQSLQLSNDNLSGQVKVLQGDRSVQMFIYGAVTMLVGLLAGYLLSARLLTARRRW